MGGCLCLPFPAHQPAGFSPSRGLLVLSLPSPPLPPTPSLWLYSSHGTPLPPPPLSSSTPPAPPLCALSGHPPCLFRWNRRGNESQSPLLTHSWDFCSTIVCISAVFHPAVFHALMLIRIYIRRRQPCLFFSGGAVGEKK